VLAGIARFFSCPILDRRESSDPAAHHDPRRDAAGLAKFELCEWRRLGLWEYVPFRVADVSGEAGAGSSWSLPSMSPGSPNALISVYRDEGDVIDRAREPGQRSLGPVKPRPLTEFQMLVAGSIGRIVPVFGADLLADVPDTFAPVQHLTPDRLEGEFAHAGVYNAKPRETRRQPVMRSGRIVLHIYPFKSTSTTLPLTLPLEGGDRFVVPPVSSTVGIVGAVYDPNSFVYQPHQHAGDYLRTAGGPNRNADLWRISITVAMARQYLDRTLWADEPDRRCAPNESGVARAPIGLQKPW
jgi:hypothetical protein